MKNSHTFKKHVIVSVGPTVAIQCENSGPSAHGTLEVRGNANHSDQSYRKQLTKMGCIIIRNTWHVKKTPITAEHHI